MLVPAPEAALSDDVAGLSIESNNTDIVSVSSSPPFGFSLFSSAGVTPLPLDSFSSTAFVSSFPFSFGTSVLETTSRVEPGLLCGREEKDS